MPIGIAEIDGIIARIGVAVDVHAGEDGIPCVGRDEAAEGGIEIAGVEIGKARFGIIPLVQESLAAVDCRIGSPRQNGAVTGQRLAGDDALSSYASYGDVRLDL
jgi:hypothetical protein